MLHEDKSAPTDEMFGAAYEELRRLAHKVNRKANPTLNATALVHEAYLKLAAAKGLQFESPEHLRYTVVRAMKHVLLDDARRKAAAIHGGGAVPAQRVELDENAVQSAAVDPRDLLAVGDALDQLAREDELQARIFELQFFGGLQVSEIAELLRLSEKKVQRVLRRAKAHLKLTLSRSGRIGEGGKWTTRAAGQ